MRLIVRWQKSNGLRTICSFLDSGLSSVEKYPHPEKSRQAQIAYFEGSLIY